jgi:hypothetical protein
MTVELLRPLDGEGEIAITKDGQRVACLVVKRSDTKWTLGSPEVFFEALATLIRKSK